MAYAPSRSPNVELQRGMVDGTYKEVVRDRGGFVEATTTDARSELNDIWFGIHETRVKRLPDGRTFNDPYCVDSKPAQICNCGM